MADADQIAEELVGILIGLSFKSKQPLRSADLQRAGDATVGKELKALRIQAFKLQTVIQGLRPQTKQKLWDAPSFVDDNGRQVRADINRLLASLSHDLEILSKVAETTDLKNYAASKHRGRRDDLKADLVTKVAAAHYRRLTGVEANRSIAERGFLPFLQAIFDVMSIKRNVERATKDYMTAARTQCRK